ncbi:MAG: hypothetical protein HYX63_10775 [Gammaproteobacteria bacterium]|nr:hypothetical protein [Gammaproteobacteria bacterium]
MSFPIAMRRHQFSGFHDYEPVSAGSQAGRHQWADERNYLRGSASDWLPTVDAAFRGIRSECGRANWDGEDAVAITSQVISTTKKVVETLYALLPTGTPAPDVIPESDGEICISWSIDVERVFSLSVGAYGKINFAGQFGKEGSVHAWQPIATSNPIALEESLQDVVTYMAKLYPPAAGGRAA